MALETHQMQAKTLLKETDLLSFLKTDSGKKFKVVRFHSAACVHCISSAKEYADLVSETSALADFAEIDIKDISCPERLPAISQIPTMAVYRRNVGCVASRVGGSTKWIRHFFSAH